MQVVVRCGPCEYIIIIPNKSKQYHYYTTETLQTTCIQDMYCTININNKPTVQLSTQFKRMYHTVTVLIV